MVLVAVTIDNDTPIAFCIWFLLSFSAHSYHFPPRPLRPPRYLAVRVLFGLAFIYWRRWPGSSLGLPLRGSAVFSGHICGSSGTPWALAYKRVPQHRQNHSRPWRGESSETIMPGCSRGHSGRNSFDITSNTFPPTPYIIIGIFEVLGWFVWFKSGPGFIRICRVLPGFHTLLD